MNADLLARNIAAHWVQSGLLVVAALAAMRVFRVGAPRLRLVTLHLTFAATLLLPFVQPWQPGVSPGLAVAETTEVFVTKFFVAIVETPPSPQVETPPSPQHVTEAVLALIAGGIVLRLLWLWGGIIRLRRLRRQEREIPIPDVAHDLESSLGVSARYFEHGDEAGPATFGLVHATVMLPKRFAALDVSTQRAIVCHELLHVKRRDVGMAALEELLFALLWFHPWVWVLRSHIRIAREQVVDRQVIALIGNREVYVRCLVEIAGHDLIPHLSAGMSSSRELRTRIDAVLEEVAMSRRRTVTTAFVLLSVVAASASVVAWAVPLTSSQSVSHDIAPHVAQIMARNVVSSVSRTAPMISNASQTAPVVSGFLTAGALAKAVSRTPPQTPQTPAPAPRRQIKPTYAEYPQDAIERGISGTVVVDIVVNAAGDVSGGAVVSGPQELHAAAFKAALALKFEAGSGVTPMRVGVEFRLTPDSWGVRITSSEPGTPSQPQVYSVSGWGGTGTQLSGMRIGGAVQPPRKIKDVPPVYPAIAQEARAQGVVMLEVSIDENGNVSDTRVLRSIPLLDQAAIDAVKQWQYTPTLLNDVAVPIVMTVTVNFSLRAQVQLRINMPDGTLVLLRTSANGMGRTEHPAMARFGFVPSLDRDPSVNTVKVTIYELAEAGSEPRLLGNVDVTEGRGAVQSATTPSFGIEVMKIDR